MAGLLDVFNSFEGQQALGLLAAAGGRSDGAGFGQRLMEGLSQGDKWKAAQAQEEMRKQQMQMQAMQIAEYQQKVADQKRMQEAAMRKQQALPTIFGQSVSAGSASPAMLGDVPMFSGGMNVQKASIAGPTRLDVQRALAAGYSPKEIQELDSLRNVGMDEVARTIDVEGANGGKTVRGLDKFGRQVFDQNGYIAPVSVNQGNQTTFVKPSAGLSLPMGMSPSEKDASARGWASNELANKKFAFEQSGGADGYSTKPLPASALKMQNDAIDAIGTAAGINKMLSGVRQQIDTGKVSFGPISNLVNQGMNAAGMSTEQSRNFSSFKSNLEKIRNESLRLNSGVQTDGDAQRAWNELFQNINDTELVKQRLGEIEALNNRAVDLQKLKVDSIRGNYKAAPFDYGKLPTSGAADMKPQSSNGWSIQKVD